MGIGIARSIDRMAAHQNRIGTTDPQQRVTQGIVSSLPYLRAGWTMGQVDYQNPYAMDINGNTYPLSSVNGPVFGVEQDRPSIYVEFDGVNQYLSRADGGAGNWADILGTETQIPAGQRGLTFGGWFKFDRLTNAEILIGKGTGVAAASSYYLAFRGDLANDPFQFTISNGAALTAVTLTFSQTVATGRWYFVCGRYTPSTETKIYVGSARASSDRPRAFPL